MNIEVYKKSKYFTLVFLVISVIVAVLLRVWNLDYLSLRLDEAQSIWQASHTTKFIFEYMVKNVHLPLHNTLLHFWIRLFGTSTFAVRFMSLIPGVLSIPALYLLSKELIGKNKSYMTVAIGVFSPIWVWYSREIRMYTLLILLSILSYLFFTRILKKGGIGSYFLYVVVNILGMYTHYFFSLVLIVQVAYFILGFLYHSLRFAQENYFKKFVLLVVSGVILLGAFEPWLSTLIKGYGSGSLAPVLPKPNPFNILLSYFEFTNGFLPDQITSIIISMWPIIILVGFIFLTKRQDPFTPGIYLALLGSTLPVIVVYVASVLIKPMYLTRYIITATPMLYILFSWYLAELSKSIKILFSAVFFVLMFMSLLIQGFHPDNPVRENYKEAVEFLLQNATYRDEVVVSPPYTIYPFNYYYKGEATVSTIPIWNKKKGGIPFTTEELLAMDIPKLQVGRRRFYVLLTDNLEGSDLVKKYFDTHYTKIEKHQFSKHVWVEVYQAEYL